MAKFITVEDAVRLIPDGSTVGVGGFCGFGAPDSLLRGMGSRYEKEDRPKNLTIVTPASAGDGREDGWGLSAIRAPGLIGSLFTSVVKLPPAVNRAVNENRIAGYFLPLGVFGHLFRAAAGGEPGVLTHIGLQTFADPRLEGCLMNGLARESGREVVRLLPVDGKDYLFYPTIKMDVAILRGTYADEDGNISTEKEAVHSETLEMANAVHNNGGIVVFQVERIVKRGALDPRLVTVHKHSVDYVTLSNPGEHPQNYEDPEYRPELVGEIQVPASAAAPMEMGLRKIIARRAAMELRKGALVNLGLGISDGVSIVVNEEGIADQITLTIETGLMGGIPLTGLSMGSGVNPDALYKMPDTFDLYNGGGLDQAFLSGAEIDEAGNVNVSKFAGKVAGPGGFINIAQNAPKVCFSGVFTAGKVDIRCEDGRLKIVQDNDRLKYVKQVEQVTFSGNYARETGKEILFISERAVFRLTPAGLMLIEIAPGVDLEKDVLAKMEFRPLISQDLKLMDERIFRPEPMGLTL
jgi:propionate CoA-transferase